jgi:hypothetical protein
MNLPTWTALLPILGTLLGVLVGGFLNPILAGRADRRARGRVAASQALEGVRDWQQAIVQMKSALVRLGHHRDDYDILLALELGKYTTFISSAWWSETRADLYGVATPDQIGPIWRAAQASRGAEDLLEGLSSAGHEALDMKERARDRRAILKEHQRPGRPAIHELDDPDIVEDAEMTALLRGPVKVHLARDTWKSIVDSLPKYDDAATALEEIIDRTEPSLKRLVRRKPREIERTAPANRD